MSRQPRGATADDPPAAAAVATARPGPPYAGGSRKTALERNGPEFGRTAGSQPRTARQPGLTVPLPRNFLPSAAVIPDMSPAGRTRSQPRLRIKRVVGEPGRSGTWDVVAHPFRVVAITSGWLVIPRGDSSRRLLVRRDLLGRQFRTRRAALSALAGALTGEPTADAGFDEGAWGRRSAGRT
jgi:hypothetical protein